MSVVMKIEGLVNGEPSPFDGQYLVEYDPERDGTAPNGIPMSAHVVTTWDPGEAKEFPSAIEAGEEWKRVCKRNPRRPDGKPNRPLTAFTVTILESP